MQTQASWAMPQRFAALDGWRGICAALVALHHLRTTGHLDALGIVRHAHLFVDFFFVLSGFVLAHAYLHKLQTAGQAAAMIWRRFARLWPLHLALLGAFVLVEAVAPIVAAVTGVTRSAASFDPASPALVSAIPTHVLMLHGMGVHDHLTWNPPSWSISTEFWTYVVFALVMLTGRRWSWWSAVALAVFGALVVMLRSTTLMDTTFDYGFFRCLYGFFVGHLTYHAVAYLRGRVRPNTAMECAAVVAVCLYVGVLGATVWSFAAPVIFALAVIVFAEERGGVSRLLRTRPLAALGLWSYSIYMVHSLLIAVMHRGLNGAGRLLGTPLLDVKATPAGEAFVISFGNAYLMDAFTLAYLGLVIVAAALTWRMIERPAQERLNAAVPRLALGLPRLMRWQRTA